MKQGLAAIYISILAGTLSVHSAYAEQRDNDAASNVLFYLPCHSWTEMHNTKGDEAVLERRTVQFAREYARENVAFLEKKKPHTTRPNADGHDVSDRRIVTWITEWCAKNPNTVLAEGAFFLATAFVMLPDHNQLPSP